MSIAFIIFTIQGCRYCKAVAQTLSSRNLPVQLLDVTEEKKSPQNALRYEVYNKFSHLFQHSTFPLVMRIQVAPGSAVPTTGFNTAPWSWAAFVGGNDELQTFLKRGSTAQELQEVPPSNESTAKSPDCEALRQVCGIVEAPEATCPQGLVAYIDSPGNGLAHPRPGDVFVKSLTSQPVTKLPNGSCHERVALQQLDDFHFGVQSNVQRPLPPRDAFFLVKLTKTDEKNVDETQLPFALISYIDLYHSAIIGNSLKQVARGKLAVDKKTGVQTQFQVQTKGFRPDLHPLLDIAKDAQNLKNSVVSPDDKQQKLMPWLYFEQPNLLAFCTEYCRIHDAARTHTAEQISTAARDASLILSLTPQRLMKKLLELKIVKNVALHAVSGSQQAASDQWMLWTGPSVPHRQGVKTPMSPGALLNVPISFVSERAGFSEKDVGEIKLCNDNIVTLSHTIVQSPLALQITFADVDVSGVDWGRMHPFVAVAELSSNYRSMLDAIIDSFTLSAPKNKGGGALYDAASRSPAFTILRMSFAEAFRPKLIKPQIAHWYPALNGVRDAKALASSNPTFANMLGQFGLKPNEWNPSIPVKPHDQGLTFWDEFFGSEHALHFTVPVSEGGQTVKKPVHSVTCRVAFLINLYNVIVQMRMVAGLGQTGCVKLANSTLTRYTFFYRPAVCFFGQSPDNKISVPFTFSLDELENGLLRGNRPGVGQLFGNGPLGKTRRPLSSSKSKEDSYKSEPRLRWCLRPDQVDFRVHAGLNCGAASCPPVRTFTPMNLASDLERAFKAFVESTTTFKVATSGKPSSDGISSYTVNVHVSRILKWYQEDFCCPLPAYGAPVSSSAPKGPMTKNSPGFERFKHVGSSAPKGPMTKNSPGFERFKHVGSSAAEQSVIHVLQHYYQAFRTATTAIPGMAPTSPDALMHPKISVVVAYDDYSWANNAALPSK